MKRHKTSTLVPILLFSAFSTVSLLGQARSSNPPQQAARPQTPAVLTESQMNDQLAQLAAQVQKLMQMPANDRTDMLREMERALNKIQESAQQLSNRRVAVTGQQPPAAPRLTLRSTRLDNTLNVEVTGGAWWTDSDLTGRLGITEDQKARIDRAFTNHRMSLVTKRDILTKEEADLQKLLAAEPLDPNAAGAQIYRVTTARAELERENATMALEMRQQMSLAQWNQLQALAPKATITVEVPVSPNPGNIGTRRGQ